MDKLNCFDHLVIRLGKGGGEGGVCHLSVGLDHFERVAADVHGQEELLHVRLRYTERDSEYLYLVLLKQDNYECDQLSYLEKNHDLA